MENSKLIAHRLCDNVKPGVRIQKQITFLLLGAGVSFYHTADEADIYFVLKIAGQGFSQPL